MKPGDKFTHAFWLDENRQPLQCVVTKVAKDRIYWKQPGELRARQFFFTDQISKYVKETN